VSSPAFNEDDVLPTTETAFSARGEAPRRAGAANPAKSGGGKIVFFGLLAAMVLGIAAVVFVKIRPADVVVEEVITTEAPGMSGASDGMPLSEAETLFASAVDSATPPDGAAATPTPAPAMTTADVAAVDPIMAAAMQSSASAQTPADLPAVEPVIEPVAGAGMASEAVTPPPSPATVPPGNEALVQRLAALEAGIAKLSKQVEGLDRDLNIVESQMPALRAQARQTAPPRTTPRAAAPSHASRPAAAAQPAQAAAPAPGFKLKAVLDGQAWIEGRDGQTYTVAAGDAVDGLGVVVEIDAVRNEVRFPAGVVLGFR
jgi:hypothetical protein